jgi:uncharacterized protein YigE (DUF2233 family)
MKKTVLFTLLSLLTLSFINISFGANIIWHITSPKNIHFYLKDTKGKVFKTLKIFMHILTHKIKAYNGGMYLKDLSPQGLYIESAKLIKKIDRIQEAYGNFYMQPNGIFYIDEDNKAVVTATKDFNHNSKINYATQSGPMLVINNKIHHKFMPNSKNIHIRNGVGILPNGDLLFSISTERINFYNFASFFKSKGCKNALYLDGFVSRMYLPQKGLTNQEGLFGVIIGEVK